MENLKVKIGGMIREARKAKGLTLKELGERLGFSESLMSRYEKGKVNASIDSLNKILAEIGYTIDVTIKEK